MRTADGSTVGRRGTSPPRSVRVSIAAWPVAIALGATEVLVHTTRPEPPSAAQLTARFVIYTILIMLVLALRSGRSPVRWTVITVLGVLGTLSLIAEPMAWLLDGGSPAAFLASADGPTLIVTVLRLAHLAAVGAGVMPCSTQAPPTFFRPATRHH